MDGNIVAGGTVSELMESVSHGHAIRLSTNKDLAPLAGKLQERFGNCSVKTEDGHTLTLFSEEPIALSPVLQYLDSLGISVFEAREMCPSLEDVFVKLTGIENPCCVYSGVYYY